MWHLRDYYDELTQGTKQTGPNNIERVIVQGLEGNEHLQLGNNPNSDMIFKKIFSVDPAIRDLVLYFQRCLPPSERQKFLNISKGPETIAVPPELTEIGNAVYAYYMKRGDLLKNFFVTHERKFQESLGKPERVAKHKKYLAQFTEPIFDTPSSWFYIPDLQLTPETPSPKYQHSFNPAYQLFLEFFAEPSQFVNREDPYYFGMMVSQQGRRGQMAKLLCNMIFTFAVPSYPVLKYMAENAPNKQIAEIGAGSGYWSLLLSKLGADIIANDNNSEGGPSKYFPIVRMDGAKFVSENGGFTNKAIFFCWARKECLGGEAVCMPERALTAYKGTDIYFVGEVNDGCTYDMEDYVARNPSKGWRKVKSLPLPNFLGTDDKFIHYRREIIKP